jgi:hypothetical protein
MRNSQKFWSKKLQGKETTWKTKAETGDNIKMYRKEIVCAGVDLFQDRVQWRDVVNMVMNLHVP